MARTRSATRYPRTTAAAARRSSIRPLVHEPMKTRSSWMPSIGVPGLQIHVVQRRGGRLAVGRVGQRGRIGHPPPVTGTTWPGLVPQVTCGATSAAWKTRARS